jgi:DDE superfamily endonuclease
MPSSTPYDDHRSSPPWPARRQWLGEIAKSGEAVCVDGLATRVQRSSGWTNQKVLYDAKRHAYTAQGLVVSTIWGDLLWCDGGWPGNCHEHELIELAGLGGMLASSGVATIVDRLYATKRGERCRSLAVR